MTADPDPRRPGPAPRPVPGPGGVGAGGAGRPGPAGQDGSGPPGATGPAGAGPVAGAGDGTWEAFWSHVERGRVCLPVCAACGRVAWYPSDRCRRCGGPAFTWPALSGRATVFVALPVFRDFTGEGRDVPYEVALVCPVEHPEVRLLARVAPPSADRAPAPGPEVGAGGPVPGPPGSAGGPSEPTLRAGDEVAIEAGEVGGRPVVVARLAPTTPGAPG